MSTRSTRRIIALALLVILGSTAPAQAQFDEVKRKAHDAMQTQSDVELSFGAQNALEKANKKMDEADEHLDQDPPGDLGKLEKHFNKVEYLLDDAAGELKTARRSLRGGQTSSVLDAADKRLDALQARFETQRTSATSQAETNAAAAEEARVASAGDAEAHIAKLHEVYEQHYANEQPLSQMHGHDMLPYDGDALEKAKAALAIFEAVEAILPEVRPIVRTFVENYGTNSMEVYNTFHEMGIEHDGVDNDFEDLYEALENYEKSRTATADRLAQDAKDVLRLADDFSPKLRMRRLAEQKEVLKVAHEIAPNHAEINQLRMAVSERFAAEAEDIQQEIDAATWKGHAAGAPTSLADDALAYLRADRDWGGREGEEVLAVAVRGGWQVAERDILGRVIRWRLPLHVATTNAEKRSTYDAASVYEVSLVAEEGAPGAAPKQPPFDGFWVGDNWMIRLAAVPQ